MIVEEKNLKAKKPWLWPGAIFFSKDLRNPTEGKGEMSSFFNGRSFCIVTDRP